MQIIPADQAEENGFAKFNGGPHLCVEVPNGHFTISAKLSDGRQITFAFSPYEENGVAKCVDVHDKGGKKIEHQGQTREEQQVICFSGGGPDPFRTKEDSDKPVTLTTILLK